MYKKIWTNKFVDKIITNNFCLKCFIVNLIDSLLNTKQLKSDYSDIQKKQFWLPYWKFLLKEGGPPPLTVPPPVEISSELL